jgi:hypothetical protein
MIWIWVNLLAVIALKVFIDRWQWKRKMVINHLAEILLVTVEVSAVTYIVKGPSYALLALQSAVYWILFDPLMALAINQHPFYLGKTSNVDKLFRKLSPLHYERLAVLVKLVFLALCFLIYYKLK